MTPPALSPADQAIGQAPDTPPQAAAGGAPPVGAMPDAAPPDTKAATGASGSQDGIRAGLSSLWNYVKNAWSASPAGAPAGIVAVAQKDPAKFASDPIGTLLQNDIDARNALFTRGKAAFAKGNDVDGARLMFDWLVPFVGPGLAKTVDQWQAGDRSGAAGTLTGLVSGVAAPAVAESAARVAPAAEATSDAALARAMVPSRGPGRIEALHTAQDVAPDLADQGVTAFTRQGLSDAVDTGLANAGRGLDQVYGAIPKTVVFGQNAILSRLQALKDGLTVSGSSGTAATTGYQMAVDAIEKAMADVKATGTLNIDNITKLRQGWQDTAADMRAYVKNPTKDITAQGASRAAGTWADAADALNDVVETKRPEVGPANRQWSLYRNGQKVLQAAEDAETLRQTGVTAGSGGILGRFYDAAVGARVPTLAYSKLFQVAADAMKNGDVNAAKGAILSIGAMAHLSQDQIDEAAKTAQAVAAGGVNHP